MEAAPRRNNLRIASRVVGACVVTALTTGAGAGCSQEDFDRTADVDQMDRADDTRQAYEALVSGKSVVYTEVYDGHIAQLGISSEEVQNKAAEEERLPEAVLRDMVFYDMHPPGVGYDVPRLKSQSMCVAADVAGAFDPADIQALVAEEQKFQALSGDKGGQEDQAQAIYAFCEKDLMEYYGAHDGPHDYVGAPLGSWQNWPGQGE